MGLIQFFRADSKGLELIVKGQRKGTGLISYRINSRVSPTCMSIIMADLKRIERSKR
jgi:hypothetical protein